MGKVIHWEMCKKFKFDHTNKWYVHNTVTVLENNTLWRTDRSPNLGQKPRPYNNNNNKRRICKIIDFAVPVDHKIKLKECEKKDKYLDLARELKNLWNMKVMIVLIVIGVFGTVSKWLLKGLEELDVGRRVKTIQTITLLGTARILGRILETWGDLLSLKLQWKIIC